MNVAIINGSIKHGSNSRKVSESLKKCLDTNNLSVKIVDPSPFTTLFTGEYITMASADGVQRQLLKTLVNAEVLVFVIPSYYRSMPGAMKNFFDIVKCPEMYRNKTIALIAANHKNQDYGAKHAEEVIRAILVFEKISATITPEILIVHHEHIDTSEIERFIRYFTES